MTGEVFYRREFLNLPGHHEGAFVLASLDDHPDREGALRYQLLIGNCDHVLRWSVDWRDRAGRENTLHKLDVLREVLGEFREALEGWYAGHPVGVGEE